jgi:DNA-binding MarR family transcriptional regulator
MSARHKTIDHDQVAYLRSKGLKNGVIAQRLGVTQGAIYHVVKRLEAKQKPEASKP